MLGSFPLINCLLQQTDLSLNRSTSSRAQGPLPDLCYNDEFLECFADISAATPLHSGVRAGASLGAALKCLCDQLKTFNSFLAVAIN